MENKKGELSKNFWYVVIGLCTVLLIFLIVGFVICEIFLIVNLKYHKYLIHLIMKKEIKIKNMN